LIGANGAGKSTTLRTITGLKRISGGEIEFAGKRIGKVTPENATKLGIPMCLKASTSFPTCRSWKTLRWALICAKTKRRSTGVIKGFSSTSHASRKGGTNKRAPFSGGEQKMLAMGRALMTDPKLILMDELSFGLSLIMYSEIAKIIRALHEEGRTIVLVEQNARLVGALAQKGYVMETGRIALEGLASDLRNN